MSNEFAKPQWKHRTEEGEAAFNREMLEDMRKAFDGQPQIAIHPTLLINPDQYARLAKHREEAPHASMVICEGCLAAIYNVTIVEDDA